MEDGAWIIGLSYKWGTWLCSRACGCIEDLRSRVLIVWRILPKRSREIF